MFGFAKSVSGSAAKSARSFKLLRGAIVVAGALGIAVLSGQFAPATSAEAASGLHYHRGNYLINSWYCYGFSNGIYHCTQHWHRSGNRIISDRPDFVPNGGSATARATTSAKAASKATMSAKAASKATSKAAPKATTSNKPATSTGGINPYPWGQCTWYARARGGSKLNGLGMARDWAWKARAKGLSVGTTPRAGSTAVFLPGVQSASSMGHLAYVEKVYANGTFLVSDMNWSGVGVITTHVMRSGAGVYFIY